MGAEDGARLYGGPVKTAIGKRAERVAAGVAPPDLDGAFPDGLLLRTGAFHGHQGDLGDGPEGTANNQSAVCHQVGKILLGKFKLVTGKTGDGEVALLRETGKARERGPVAVAETHHGIVRTGGKGYGKLGAGLHCGPVVTAPGEGAHRTVPVAHRHGAFPDGGAFLGGAEVDDGQARDDDAFALDHQDTAPTLGRAGEDAIVGFRHLKGEVLGVRILVVGLDGLAAVQLGE